MSIAETLAIIITADGGGAVREFEKVGKSAERDLGKAETSAQSMSAGLLKTGAIMTGIGAVFEVGFFKAAEATGVHETALAKLNNTIENNKKLAGQDSTAYEAQAEAIAHSTAMSREDVITTQALIGQYKTSGTQIQTLTPLIGDMALKMGKDLPSAAMAVGKALEGNSTSLRRMGVMVDENVYKTDRYKAVQEALNSTVGGFAEQQGKTFEGQMAIVGHEVNELTQSVGVGAAQAFGRFGQMAGGAANMLNSMNPSLAAGIGEWGTYGATALIAAGVISMVAGGVMRLALTTAQYKAMQAAKTEATVADTVATQAEATAEGEAAAATEAHAAAAGEGAAAMATEAESASALAISEMSVAGALSAVAAGAVIGFAALSKLQDVSNQNQSEMFGKMDFTDLEAANGKLDVTGQKINDLSDRWNNYSATEKLTHAFEWKNLQDLIAQQDEYRKQLDAGVDTTKKVGDAMKISAKDAEALMKQLHIDPSQFGVDKLVPELTAFKDGGKSAEQVALDLRSGFVGAGDGADDASGNVDKLNKAVMGAVDAQHSYDSALAKVSDAEQAVQDGAQRIVDAQAKVQDATRAVADAEQSYRDSLTKVQDAVQKVTDAERKLQDVEQGGKHGDDYALGKKEAAVGLEEANKRLADSQKKLQEAKTPADKEQARIDVERAQIEVERAHNAVTDAGTAQANDLKAAQDGVKQAQDGVTSAQRAAQKAAEGISKAENEVAKASGEVAKAQEAEAKNVRAVGDAQYEAMKAMDALMEKQAAEKQALLDQSGAVADLTAKYLALGPAAGILLQQIGGGPGAVGAAIGSAGASSGLGVVGSYVHMASGGMSGPRQEINEAGTEILHQGGRDYLLGPPGRITPAGGFDLHSGGDAGGQGSGPITIILQADGKQLAKVVVPHLPSVQRAGR